MGPLICVALLLSGVAHVAAQNFQKLIQSPLSAAGTCTGPVASKPTQYWLDQQDHTGPSRGYAPYINNFYHYNVYRNVRQTPYNAAGDGKRDDTDSIQNALNDNSQGGNRYFDKGSNEPALVFVPGGTYSISRPIDMRLNTILVGDPNNPPVFKATANFNGDALIHGRDLASGAPETSFFVAIKNIVIDTTSIDKGKSITALGWGVAQACHLTNIKINMPSSSTGHIGIDLQGGSTIAITDVSIVGGAIGIRNANQQVNFKNISFLYCTTAFELNGGWTVVIQGAKFDTCGLGVDMPASGLGVMVLLDSTSVNSGPTVKFWDSSRDNGNRNDQVIIENLSHSGTNPIAIDTFGKVLLPATASVDTWIWGNVDPGNYQTGKLVTMARPASLLDNGKFFTKQQPTYQQYASDQIVNVKAVAGFPVKGDGKTDDSTSLNAILAQNAANCKISYFPYGVYSVKQTLYVPPGSRIVGEAWSVISGTGATFGDRNNPKPVVMVGKPGEVGVAEIQDMRFTVGDISPGAIILQVNMAGANKGDVAFWNTHILVGGTKDSNVNYACSSPNPTDCPAAFAIVHLAKTSSTYIENMWGWTADHTLDDGGNQNIATGRGLLVEATEGTWLVGTGFEHNTLYNYNIHNAQNVYAGMQQTETAYWQGDHGPLGTPAPWSAVAAFGDPDFSWCGGGDLRCRMGLAQNIDGGANLYLYGAAFWTFFNGMTDGNYANFCQDGAQFVQNQARVTGNPKNLYWYGIGTKCATTVVLDGAGSVQMSNNPGGWGGVVAAYLPYSGTFAPFAG